MIDLDSAAEAQAKASGEDPEEWKTSLHHYSESGELVGLTDGEIQRFLKALRSVKQLQRIHTSLAQEKGSLDKMLGLCENSSYELSDWLWSYDCILLWLEKQKKQASPSEILTYLQECSNSASTDTKSKSLAERLEVALKQKGFHGRGSANLKLVTS